MVCLSRRLVRFAAAAAFIPLPAFAGEIVVPLDNVTTVTLSRPAKTIYVGNPAVEAGKTGYHRLVFGNGGVTAHDKGQRVLNLAEGGHDLHQAAQLDAL